MGLEPWRPAWRTLAHKACRDGRRVAYHRVPKLFEALAIARGDGRHARMLKALERTELLILDDWGLSVLTAPERRDLLEILEDRHGRGSTIVTSQLPVEHWHEAIGDPTLADAILDRLVHNAHRLPPVFVKGVVACTCLRPLAWRGRPWVRRRQLSGGVRRRPHGLRFRCPVAPGSARRNRPASSSASCLTIVRDGRHGRVDTRGVGWRGAVGRRHGGAGRA